MTESDSNIPLVHTLFTDGMVLQQGRKIEVWGWASSGATVTVALLGQEVVVQAGAAGGWRAEIGPLPPGGPHTLTIRGPRLLELKNVMVGEVWVCSGQSNMEMALREVMNGEAEVMSAADPDLRLFTVPKLRVDRKLDCIAGHWDVCTPDTAREFSATALFFGRHLRRTLGTPVGLIHASSSGSPAEMWVPADTLAADPEFANVMGAWAEGQQEVGPAWAAYQEAARQWNGQAMAAVAAGRPLPPMPPGNDRFNRYAQPGTFFNGMIAPLQPFAIRGVIWYQGESNVSRARQYRKLFPALIRDWRRTWGQDEFPFLFVQLANYLEPRSAPGDSAFAELREAQRLTWKTVPGTGMAVAIDLGDAARIHPLNKQEVGRRLGLIAESMVYRKPVACSGPVFRAMRVKGNSVELTFDPIGGGLVARGGSGLDGFAVAGADSHYVRADARIVGDTVVVSSPRVPIPAAVRYAWADNPPANLYNQAGLPASPFGTDD